MKLDIGCGLKKEPGWIGIDCRPEVKPDLLRDLRRGLPFTDNTVDEIRCNQVLEHLASDDLMFVLEEMIRVCRPGAHITISVPHVNSMGAWSEPTHVRCFHERQFRMLTSPSYFGGRIRIVDLHVDRWRQEDDTEDRANIICIYEVC